MSTYVNIFKLFLLPLRSDFLKGFLLFAVQNTGHLNLCLPLTCCRSMVFSEHCGFLHQYNWPSRFNWNIVSSGITHHNSNPWFLPSVILFWPMSCLLFSDIKLMISLLVSSNCFYENFAIKLRILLSCSGIINIIVFMTFWYDEER